MIRAGALTDVDSIVALHVDPERRTGQIGYRQGTMTAFCVEVDVLLRGRGGHAARPHHGTDPILAACQFVSACYQFVPRAVDSRQAVVVTFGSIHGGASQNVIPEEVRLRGTARTHSHASTVKVEERIEEIAEGIAEASGTEIEVSFKRGPDAVVNDRRVTEVCLQAASELLGPAALEPIAEPSMGGEDFAEYLSLVPGCLLRLGVSADPARAHFLHSARFDIDERALAVGAKLLARTAVLLARRPA
jgi:amidohydrolase